MKTARRDESKLALPSPEDVIATAARLGTAVRRTPILESATLNRLCERRVLLKAEHLQITGSYKVRGAVNNLRVLQERHGTKLRGVVAASSGNHGQAVAWAARRVGVAATIVLPANAVPAKRAAIESYGADVITVGTDPAALSRVSTVVAHDDGLVEIEAFDHPLTITGQGTCALEALDQAPEIECIIVPIGGGGLAAGTVLAAHAVAPDVRIFAVEPERAADTHRSFHAGRRITVQPSETIADALLSPKPGKLTFAINRDHLADVITVTERAIADAMRVLAERTKQLVEPSGAVALAAVLQGLIPGTGPVLVVLSGGNADLARLSTIWAEVEWAGSEP